MLLARPLIIDGKGTHDFALFQPGENGSTGKICRGLAGDDSRNGLSVGLDRGDQFGPRVAADANDAEFTKLICHRLHSSSLR